MPFHPKLLEGCKVGVVGMEDGCEGAESRNSGSLGEQDQTGQVAGVILHCKQLRPVLVELSVVVIDSKMGPRVFCLAVACQEGLRAK